MDANIEDQARRRAALRGRSAHRFWWRLGLALLISSVLVSAACGPGRIHQGYQDWDCSPGYQLL